MEEPTMVSKLSGNNAGLTDLIIQTVLLSLCFLSVGLRLWSRRLQRKELQLNDWLIVAAMTLMVGRYIVEMIVIIKCGLGLHLTEIFATVGPIGAQKLLMQFAQLAYSDDLFWVTIVALVKISILHLYIQVFRQPLFVKCAWGAIGLCVIVWIAGFLARALLCIPVDKNWIPTLDGSCGSTQQMYSGIASTDLVVDVIVIVFPMPILWNLQMKTAKKIALTGIFALGFVIIAITCVRIKFMLELSNQDVTHSFSNIALFSALVPLLGIINACLPVMPPAFKKVFRSTMFSTHHSGYSGSGGQAQYLARKKLDNSKNSSTGPPFERLDDPDVPLVEMPMKGGAPHNNIRVTTDWEVHSARDPEMGFR